MSHSQTHHAFRPVRDIRAPEPAKKVQPTSATTETIRRNFTLQNGQISGRRRGWHRGARR